MSSLYSAAAWAVFRLIIISKSNNSWLEASNISFRATRALQIIWIIAISVAFPPLVGFGRYGQDMVGTRYAILSLTGKLHPYLYLILIFIEFIQNKYHFQLFTFLV